jgi:hypothetical protein
MKNYILLFCLTLLGCENAPQTTQQKSLPAQQPPIVPVKKPVRTRVAYPKLDSIGKIFYLAQYYTPTELSEIKQEELDTWQTALEKQYNQKFKTKHFSKYFDIAYRCTDAEASKLEYITNVFFKGIYTRFFKYEPEFPFKIVYFAHKAEFTQYTGSEAYGFYQPRSRTLFTYAYSGEGTLWHELVHAFVDANIDHNIQEWFSEGFASFYEMGGIAHDTFVEGYTNWRLPLLQKMLKRADYLPLPDFLEEQDMSEDNAYAKARFLFCYLWIYDKMDAFAKKYLYELSAQYKGKELAEKSIVEIEHLVGKDFTALEKEYNEWAMKFIPSQKLQKIK